MQKVTSSSTIKIFVINNRVIGGEQHKNGLQVSNNIERFAPIFVILSSQRKRIRLNINKTLI